MKKIIISCIAFILALNIYGQEPNEKEVTGVKKDFKNSLFISYGGVAITEPALNYDRLLRLNDEWGVLLGVGFSPFRYSSIQFLPVYSMQFNVVMERKKWKILMGFGASRAPALINNNPIQTSDDGFIHILARFSYQRYIAQRFYFGLGFTPILAEKLPRHIAKRTDKDPWVVGFYPWASIRFGYSF